jgi:PleD family two-component response regulator
MDRENALVIDDDADIANLFCMVLSLIGYNCETANSARSALSRLAASSPGLILLDLHLESELGGADILYQIRTNPRLKNSCVVIITGHPEMAIPVTSLADYVLHKPINIDQLKKVVLSLKAGPPPARRDYLRDPITGSYSQDLFASRLQHAAERFKRRPAFVYAVCVFEIGLQQSARTTQGDSLTLNLVLRDVSSRLTNNLRPTDTVARLAFSRFATLHEELVSPDDLRTIVQRIQTILTPPFQVNNQLYNLWYQIGRVTNAGREPKENLLELAEKDLQKRPVHPG